MTTTRKTALVAGVFFLITEVTAITALLSYGTILTDPSYIIDGSVDNTRVLVGAFLEVLLAIAVVGTSVTLYPVIKTYGPGLALGHVAGRLIEAAIILVGAISLLTVVTLQSQLNAPDAEAEPRPPSPWASRWWPCTTGPSCSVRSWPSGSTPSCWPS